MTKYESIHYCIKKFCIGWGTLRVSIGIVMGQIIYDFFMENI